MESATVLADAEKTSFFFRLPPELRTAVYALLNPHKGTYLDAHRQSRLPILPLLSISRQFRSEAAHAFFSSQIYRFYLCFDPPAWLHQIDPKHLASIQHIIIEDYQSKSVKLHPTPVCYSRIEINLSRISEGVEKTVTKFTDIRCKSCMRRVCVAPKQIVKIVESMERSEGCTILTYDKLKAIFDAAKYHFSEEGLGVGEKKKLLLQGKMLKTELLVMGK